MGKDLKGKELGKGISQLKNGKYHARYVNRFGVRSSIYGNTLKETWNKLAKAVADDNDKKNVVNPSTTLDEWYEKWMRVYKIPVVREKSAMKYSQLYTSKISPVIGRIKISEITKLQLTDLMNGLKADGYSWETLNSVKILITDMFARALEDEFLIRNPAKGVRNPKNKPTVFVKALTKEEQEDFLECSAGTYYHNMFVVALNTGLRPGELFALNEDDIDFSNHVINVSKNMSYEKFDGDEQKEFHIGPPKTDSSIRSVPINNTCEVALRKQIKQNKVIRDKIRTIHSEKRIKRREEFSGLLFTTSLGTPLNTEVYNTAIENIIKEMNLLRDPLDAVDRISGHTFRHTFATRCFEVGIPPKVVQTYLGHASLQMTMDLYTHVFESKKYDEILLLDELSQGIKPPTNKVIQMPTVAAM